MKKIVLFEDSLETAQAYKQSAHGEPVLLSIYSSPFLTSQEIEEITELDPDLFVVDLLLGSSRNDGYGLIRSLREIIALREVPIVVVSKFINSSQCGQQVVKTVLSLGASAAFGKIPSLPSVSTLLSYCRERNRKDGS